MALNKLTDSQAKAFNAPGRYSDGGNLYIAIAPGGSKSWVFMYRQNGKQHEMSLGPFSALKLSEARERAATYRTALADNKSPITVRNEAIAAAAQAERDAAGKPTFGDYAKTYIDRRKSDWKTPKQALLWTGSLTKHAAPIWNMKLDEIKRPHVLKCLLPIWSTIPETAQRVQKRIEAVIDSAIGEEIIPGPNPAYWKTGLDRVLVTRKKLQRGHHPAMKHEDLPAFIARLQTGESVASLALEMTILCASRSGEVRSMTWEEIDTKARLWTIPAKKMKMKRDHTVPLTGRALAILEKLRPLASTSDTTGKGKAKPEEAKPTGIVFKGPRGGALSDMALTMHLRRRDLGHLTVHGFRSTFRDWVTEATEHRREFAELALAHAVGNEVERAYSRSEAIDKRRLLMNDWETFTQSDTPDGIRQRLDAIRSTIAEILLAVNGGAVGPLANAKT